MLLLVVLAEGEHRCYHNVYDSRRLPIVNVTLASGRLVEFLVVFQHLDLVRSVLWIRAVVNIISSKELGDDEGVHPAEEAPEDDEAGDDLRPEFHQLFEVDGVGGLAEHAEGHVQDAENNGHFHFDAVYECKLVLGASPHWVLSKWIDTLVVISPPGARFGLGRYHCSICKLLRRLELNCFELVHLIARAIDIRGDGEELIVDVTAVEGHNTH